MSYFCIVKNFIRIFTIYFLVLTFLPVGNASGSCCDEKNEEKIEVCAADNEKNTSNECGGDCGGICYCSCCGHIFILTFAPDLTNVELPPLAQTMPQLASQMHGIIFPSGIWQPPQFG